MGYRWPALKRKDPWRILSQILIPFKDLIQGPNPFQNPIFLKYRFHDRFQDPILEPLVVTTSRKRPPLSDQSKIPNIPKSNQYF